MPQDPIIHENGYVEYDGRMVARFDNGELTDIRPPVLTEREQIINRLNERLSGA